MQIRLVPSLRDQNRAESGAEGEEFGFVLRVGWCDAQATAMARTDREQ